MRLKLLVPALTALMLLTGCSGVASTGTPTPYTLSDMAIGYYCGMNLVEHPGPKGQILLASTAEPVWFSSARDTLTFTMLPEEPKDIVAIYVSDMGAAKSWDVPGVDNWIDAKAAYFVIGSSQVGGMGVAEAVPFAQKTKAEVFAAEYGGTVVGFADIPRDYVLGESATAATPPAHSGTHG